MRQFQHPNESQSGGDATRDYCAHSLYLPGWAMGPQGVCCQGAVCPQQGVLGQWPRLICQTEHEVQSGVAFGVFLLHTWAWLPSLQQESQGLQMRFPGFLQDSIKTVLPGGAVIGQGL